MLGLSLMVFRWPATYKSNVNHGHIPVVAAPQSLHQGSPSSPSICYGHAEGDRAADSSMPRPRLRAGPQRQPRRPARRRHRLYRPNTSTIDFAGNRRPPPHRHRDSARQARDPLLYPSSRYYITCLCRERYWAGLKTLHRHGHALRTVGTASHAPTSATTSAAWEMGVKRFTCTARGH